MLEERDGWFVVNVRNSKWRENPVFGRVCGFEMQEPFEQIR